MSKRYKRYFIKAKEAKEILREASEKLRLNLEDLFGSEARMELVEADFGKIFFLVNGNPILFKDNGEIFPTLHFKAFISIAPKVSVDMGAVSHICNGADVMAPGIVNFKGSFSKGDLVVVVDERHGKPIAIGEIIYSSDEASKVKRGVVVKNIHFVGDRVWNFIKSLMKPAE